jgi:hypothetical protein
LTVVGRREEEWGIGEGKAREGDKEGDGDGTRMGI